MVKFGNHTFCLWCGKKKERKKKKATKQSFKNEQKILTDASLEKIPSVLTRRAERQA